jgi:hypothetical protein
MSLIWGNAGLGSERKLGNQVGDAGSSEIREENRSPACVAWESPDSNGFTMLALPSVWACSE